MTTIDDDDDDDDLEDMSDAVLAVSDDEYGDEAAVPPASTTAASPNDWTELVGPDLLLKILSRGSSKDDCDMTVAAEVQPHDAVRVDFVGRPAESVVEATVAAMNVVDDDDPFVFHIAQDMLVVVSEKDVPPCLELAIRYLSEGDTALVWSHSKYAHGASQRQHKRFTLPAHANVCYQVTVHSIIDDDTRNSPEFTLQAALTKKMLANDVYANELWSATTNPEGLATTKSRAIYLYNRAIAYCDQLLASVQSDDDDDDDDDVGAADGPSASSSLRTQAIETHIDCLNNLTAVHLRTKDYKQAKATAIRVLVKDANSLKALVRVAKASLYDPASNHDEVKAAIRAAQEVLEERLAVAAENTSSFSSSCDLRALQKDLQAVRTDFQQKKRDYKEKTKVMMAKMSHALQQSEEGKDSKASSNVDEPKEQALNDVDSATNEQSPERGVAKDDDAATTDDDELEATLDKLKELKESIVNDASPVFDLPSWKSQMMQSFMQILLPIAIFWLVRYVQGMSGANQLNADEL